ncbi:MAG TPA: 50S ribosomal protein L21 [Flavobacteriia bacterium]|nr:50S ribosomal protein L21 [Flavobacteriia bacterium]
MYAIVEIAGQQFKVSKDQKVFVHRLKGAEGEVVNFDNVLLLDNDGQITIGAPVIEGAAVSAKILRHLKGDKKIVFKKKRRKGYKKKNGHRQYLTEILVEEVTASGNKPAKKTAKKETKAAPKKAAKADDLKKIEGIGPKIASILAEAGFDTFAKLAKADPKELSEILIEKGGKRYAMYNPETWPKQAELAAEGKWDELKKWQDELNGGRA